MCHKTIFKIQLRSHKIINHETNSKQKFSESFTKITSPPIFRYFIVCVPEGGGVTLNLASGVGQIGL